MVIRERYSSPGRSERERSDEVGEVVCLCPRSLDLQELSLGRNYFDSLSATVRTCVSYVSEKIGVAIGVGACVGRTKALAGDKVNVNLNSAARVRDLQCWPQVALRSLISAISITINFPAGVSVHDSGASF